MHPRRARVLARETEDQLTHLASDRRTPRSAVRIRPAATDEPAMPAPRDAPRRRPNGVRQQPAQRREQQPVMWLKPRLADLPAEDRHFATQHQNLKLVRSVAPHEENYKLQTWAHYDVHR